MYYVDVEDFLGPNHSRFGTRFFRSAHKQLSNRPTLQSSSIVTNAGRRRVSLRAMSRGASFPAARASSSLPGLWHVRTVWARMQKKLLPVRAEGAAA
jgi:hypothetical protein